MDTRYVGSEKAAEILGVSRATLYAYVSRGMVRTKRDPEQPRRQLYDARELNALARQKRRGRKPREAAARALDWGLPVMDTSLRVCAETAHDWRAMRLTRIMTAAA